jgi:hypothetical protein
MTKSIAAIFIIFVLTDCGSNDQGHQTSDDPITVDTSKGQFTVPGIAFIDGSDPDADPPLTLMDINIWDSYTRTRVVCTSKHGTKAFLREVRYSAQEERYYFRVAADDCLGWLPEAFLSSKAKAVVGTIH